MKLPACQARLPIVDSNRCFLCSDRRMNARNNLVTAEMCKVCDLWKSPTQNRHLHLSTADEVILWRPRTIAVVIPCHNYGRFLGEALESVCNQTRPAQEVLVVDDASDDNTSEIVARFAARGVKYVRVAFRHSQRSRHAGFELTQSDVICFLDADDVLSADYFERGLKQFIDSRIALVYSDAEYFGRESGRLQTPETYQPAKMERMNFIHSGSLVLREALTTSRALEIVTDDQVVLQDWLLWRRVLSYGWKAVKQEAVYYYRRHTSSMSERWKIRGNNRCDYFERAALNLEKVTLFIPLAGRSHLWADFADFLNRQTWPHRQIRLVLLDTSHDPSFGKMVREWIAQSDYTDVTYSQETVGEPGIAELPRAKVSREVSQVMARIYNRMAREVTTDYVWIVEDDVFPPVDACKRLLQSFDQDTASVTGAYLSRSSRTYVAWDFSQRQISQLQSGVQQVGGNGFGCVMIRGQLIRDTVFTATIDCPAYDNAFYYRLPTTGMKALLNWDVLCEHRTQTQSLQGAVS